MFLIRAVFWLSLVIAFIPVNPQDLQTGQRAVSTQETIGVVRSAITDVSGFCNRNPQSCDTGKELFAQFGAKAKTGAFYVHDFLDRRLREDPAGETGPTDGIRTGSVKE